MATAKQRKRQRRKERREERKAQAKREAKRASSRGFVKLAAVATLLGGVSYGLVSLIQVARANPTASTGDERLQVHEVASATAPRNPRATAQEPSFSMDDMVTAYVGGQEPWKRMRLGEVKPGQDFYYTDQIYYFQGGLRRATGVNKRNVADAVSGYDRATHRSPEADDVVAVRLDGQHSNFSLLRDVTPGSQIVFQGAVYSTIALNGYLQIRPTGDVFKRVTRVFRPLAGEIVDLKVRDEQGQEYTISGTPDHPFYVPAAGDYIAMGQLLPGVQLHTADYGAVATVASKSSRKGGFEVFNFEVEDTHNYYVRSQDGGPAVLVHNICLKPNDTLTPRQGDIMFQPLGLKKAKLDNLRQNWDPAKAPGVDTAKYYDSTQVVEFNGKLYAQQGNHRLRIAMERGETVPIRRITPDEYKQWKGRDFDPDGYSATPDVN